LFREYGFPMTILNTGMVIVPRDPRALESPGMGVND